MSEKQTKIIQAIKDSNIKINKETGGICSMKYFSNHECSNCKRQRLCDYICNLEEKEITNENNKGEYQRRKKTNNRSLW